MKNRRSFIVAIIILLLFINQTVYGGFGAEKPASGKDTQNTGTQPSTTAPAQDYDTMTDEQKLAFLLEDPGRIDSAEKEQLMLDSWDKIEPPSLQHKIIQEYYLDGNGRDIPKDLTLKEAATFKYNGKEYHFGAGTKIRKSGGDLYSDGDVVTDSMDAQGAVCKIPLEGMSECEKADIINAVKSNAALYDAYGVSIDKDGNLVLDEAKLFQTDAFEAYRVKLAAYEDKKKIAAKKVAAIMQAYDPTDPEQVRKKNEFMKELMKLNAEWESYRENGKYQLAEMLSENQGKFDPDVIKKGFVAAQKDVGNFEQKFEKLLAAYNPNQNQEQKPNKRPIDKVRDFFDRLFDARVASTINRIDFERTYDFDSALNLSDSIYRDFDPGISKTADLLKRLENNSFANESEMNKSIEEAFSGGYSGRTGFDVGHADLVVNQETDYFSDVKDSYFETIA